MNSDKNLQVLLAKYRLSPDEHSRIVKRLGREPKGIEWALFSALWSEHCSYKSSRVHLRKFAGQSKRVVQSMGENAGVIDLGCGEKVAFKMESHNHPSFIEPYQGAATGVGGILRDIFTMGARPVALANYLCFGEPQANRMASLVEGVVGGIGGYGNCVGVPTITGQTEFHSSYNENILVNALAVGLFREGEPVVTSGARGTGNLVVYVGAKTGRDGVHGASMASESFSDDSASKRPTVQIGDPFFEKLLIESCLEVMAEKLVVAIQDMGAAGLTSSTFEMAAKGGVGMRLRLDQVPLRDSSLGPEEILLSESQERMLLVCEPKSFERIQEIFRRWGLDAQTLGEITPGPEVELYWHQELICKIDPKLLVEEAPIYERPYEPWDQRRQPAGVAGAAARTSASSASALHARDLPKVLTTIEGTSRQWIYRQYDSRVGAKTVRDCTDSVGVIRLPDSGRALGLVLGCRPSIMREDARLGACDAVIYPALELSAKGFEPLAMTDCLNFGNPEKIEVMSEFVASVDAIATCSRQLQIPVISGNVSFYNSTREAHITSTPATGLVGLRETLDGLPKSQFLREGQEIWLWRMPHSLTVSDGSQAQRLGRPHPMWNLDVVNAWLAAVRGMAASGIFESSRVVGKFGLAYALFRMCTESLGASVMSGEWSREGWQSETLYEVLAVTKPGCEAEVTEGAGLCQSTAWRIGRVVNDRFTLGETELKLGDLHDNYRNGWRTHFAQLA